MFYILTIVTIVIAMAFSFWVTLKVNKQCDDQ